MGKLFSVLLLVGLPLAASAPAGKDPTPSEIEEIIQKFAAKEAEFAQARENYTYRQSAKVQEIDEAGTPRGKWEMVSDIIFSREGKRTEHVVRAPMTTLRNIQLTPEDEQDLRSVQPFVLTTKDIGKYYVNYLGRQNADEIPCFVFAVKPKKMEPGQRYFSGQVWVDDRDLQIVKSYGRGVGLVRKSSDYQFPKFETYREQIDGKYWFPTYTHADDTLVFREMSQRIRMTVKYQDYKRFGAESSITFGDEVPDTPAKPAPKK
jgi:outer membrane lipoprotein-sorting protein